MNSERGIMGGWCFCALALMALVIVADMDQVMGKYLTIESVGANSSALPCEIGNCIRYLPDRRCRCHRPDDPCVIYKEWGDLTMCGSDGETYNNDCELGEASCRENKVIEIWHCGPCTDWDRQKAVWDIVG